MLLGVQLEVIVTYPVARCFSFNSKPVTRLVPDKTWPDYQTKLRKWVKKSPRTEIVSLIGTLAHAYDA